MIKRRLGIIFLLEVIILLFICFDLYADDSLTDWSDWKKIEEKILYRIRCVRYNKSARQYVWEVEINNSTNSTLGISIRLYDADRPEPKDKWTRNSMIKSGKAYIFPLLFCYGGPGTKLKFEWKDIIKR